MKQAVLKHTTYDKPIEQSTSHAESHSDDIRSMLTKMLSFQAYKLDLEKTVLFKEKLAEALSILSTGTQHSDKCAAQPSNKKTEVQRRFSIKRKAKSNSKHKAEEAEIYSIVKKGLYKLIDKA